MWWHYADYGVQRVTLPVATQVTHPLSQTNPHPPSNSNQIGELFCITAAKQKESSSVVACYKWLSCLAQVCRAILLVSVDG